jgi:hypothetical protein
MILSHTETLYSVYYCSRQVPMPRLLLRYRRALERRRDDTAPHMREHDDTTRLRQYPVPAACNTAATANAQLSLLIRRMEDWRCCRTCVVISFNELGNETNGHRRKGIGDITDLGYPQNGGLEVLPYVRRHLLQ